MLTRTSGYHAAHAARKARFLTDVEVAAAPVRVGVFTDSYLPRISGVVRSIEAFVSELRRQGHHVSIFAPGYRGFVDADPDVVRFPSVRPPGHPDFPLAIPVDRRFLAKLAARRPSVIHTHSPFLMGAAGRYAARRLGLPLVFTHHTMYAEYVHYVPLFPPRLSRQVVTRYTARYCNRCTAVIAPSRAVRAWLRSIGVVTPIEVLPTAGFELARFDRLDPSWVRPRYGVPSGAPLVITVGRLASEKRFDILLAAFADAARGGPAHLLVVGGGPEAPVLRHLAGQLGVGSQVIFTGPLDHDRVLDCYAAADVFAFASPTETQGLVVIEAMAAGLPVAAVRAGGVAEAVGDGETGLLVDPDPAALAAAIRRLLHDEPLRRRLSAGGREVARAYAIDVLTRRLVDLYRNLMTDGPLAATPD
ncbi:MAG: glycosyltransferase family 4 protein [Armatimonadota bacterium]|nr:glycosyltransferase family 4 protein [Armatimonadota bacterium]MDR7533932.1 glycosyltransferase family 4 protein [Armatimonadota bacterium]MDR7536054.1 glycosyltransferase family 4 protein [Armatimonadota bacterium]